MLSSEEIKNILPHRYPFLLVDRMLEVEEGKRAVAIKNVTANEDFFNGHFPGYPVMPGVLIVEAMAQAGGAALLMQPENKDKLIMFAGIDSCRFKGKVQPGDQLKLDVEIIRARKKIGKGHGTASVDGKVVAEADIMFALQDKE